jgi:hypothetical protein
MRTVQPVGQQACRFVGSRTVKRHQRRREARGEQQVGAPSIPGDRRDLDEVWSSRNSLFKAMYEICHESVDVLLLLRRTVHSCAAASADQAKATTKARPQSAGSRIVVILRENKFCCRSVNSFFTGHPQVIHTAFVESPRKRNTESRQKSVGRHLDW